jgi:hypothetical protein
MPKTEKERKARKTVNNCIVNTKSSDINRIINVGRLSQKKRDKIKKKKEEKEKREREVCDYKS